MITLEVQISKIIKHEYGYRPYTSHLNAVEGLGYHLISSEYSSIPDFNFDAPLFLYYSKLGEI